MFVYMCPISRHYSALEVGVAHQGNLISVTIVVCGRWVWLESVCAVCVSGSQCFTKATYVYVHVSHSSPLLGRGSGCGTSG